MRSMVLGCCAMCTCGAYAYNNVNSGIDYDRPLTEVHATLAAMPMPGELESAAIRTDASDPGKVSWEFGVDGEELGEVTATLTAQDADTTNVHVEFQAGDGLEKGSSARAMAMQPLVEQVAETIVAEQIGATLENRPFNKRAVGLELATYVSSHPKEMRQYMTSLQTMMDEANSTFAFQSEFHPGGSRAAAARIGGARPMNTAKPMVDLSVYR